MRPPQEIDCHLRRHRRAADLTQEQLAEHSGVTRQTIISIEKGKFVPSVGLALVLAKVLEVKVEDLFELKQHEDDAQS